MTVIKDTANDISELPFQCFPEFICKVNNTADSTADDYYEFLNLMPLEYLVLVLGPKPLNLE